MNKINKILTLIFIIFAFASTAKAQDKIITINGDTINCKIIEISPEKITYERKLQDNSVVSRLIYTNNVREYICETDLSSNSPDMNQEIEIYNYGRILYYFLGEHRLTLKNMLIITKNTPNAYTHLNSAYNFRIASYVSGFLGGFGMGYCTYAAIIAPSRSYVAQNAVLNWVVFGSSIILIGCSIDFKYQANKRIIHGIRNYNNSLKNKNNLSLNIGFSPTGIGLKIGL